MRSRSRSLSSMSSYSRSHSLELEDEGYRLYVGDIGEGVSKKELISIFEEYGTLKEFWMANSPPCFGFAVFKHRRDAREALTYCDGMTVCGSRIRVSVARPRTRGHGRRCFSPSMRCYNCGNHGHFYRDCLDNYDHRSFHHHRSSKRNYKSHRDFRSSRSSYRSRY